MEPSWWRFAGRVVVAHTATYLVAGLVAMQLLDYAEFWEAPTMSHMRPLDSPWVAAGPALQVVRGLVFAAVLWPFRSVFLARANGWLPLWGLLVGIGILSTYGPSPGSIEGLIYTTVPLSGHLRGLPEVVLQSLAFSGCLVGWCRRPHWGWTVVLGGLAGLALLASLAGVLLAP
jgi:hypothetical protein